MTNARICRYSDMGFAPDHASRLDTIFFEASNTKTFKAEADRSAFRERWLGRYLSRFPNLAHVALAPGGKIIGYIVGAHVDPARTVLFDDIDDFAAFGDLTRAFPAHLHVNMAPEARGQGIGTRLVGAFLADARAAAIPGVHVVTSRGARNVAFYSRNGFLERGTSGDGDRAVVFLGRRPI